MDAIQIDAVANISPRLGFVFFLFFSQWVGQEGGENKRLR